MRKKFLLLVVLLAGFATSAFALNPAAESDFGVKGGLVLGGTWDTDYGSVDTDPGLALGVFGDFRVADKMWVGAFFDFTLANDENDNSCYEYDLGVALKALFNPPNVPFLIRPSLAIAYGLADSDSVNDTADLFVINLSVEGITDNAEGLSYFGEFGFTAVPAGGNEDTDLTHGPIFFLKGGVIF